LIFQPHSEPKKSITDFKGLRLVTRQPGSGADNYLKNLLKSENLNLSDFVKTEIVYSEIDAVSLVLSGQADVTLGIASEAEKYKLKFIPVVKERFDLVIDRFCWFESPFQKLLQFSQTTEFFDAASRLKGYNIKDLGVIHFNSKQV
jgi:molybdate-binding protein